jgi:hypothetical protein
MVNINLPTKGVRYHGYVGFVRLLLLKQKKVLKRLSKSYNARGISQLGNFESREF